MDKLIKCLSSNYKLYMNINRYKRQTHIVHVYNSTTPVWLNVTLLEEDLNDWSEAHDFGLKTNIDKMETYSNRELFLSDLKELENSLSNVAELVTQMSDSTDSSIIQFKITENVKKDAAILVTNNNSYKLHYL